MFKGKVRCVVSHCCSDKTGTLTENNMRVVQLMAGGHKFSVRPSITSSRPPQQQQQQQQDSIALGSQVGTPAPLQTLTRVLSSIGAGALSSTEAHQKVWGTTTKTSLNLGSSSGSGASSRSSMDKHVPSSVQQQAADCPWLPGSTLSRFEEIGGADLLTRVSLSLDEGSSWGWEEAAMSRDLGEEAAEGERWRRVMADMGVNPSSQDWETGGGMPRGGSPGNGASLEDNYAPAAAAEAMAAVRKKQQEEGGKQVPQDGAPVAAAAAVAAAALKANEEQQQWQKDPRPASSSTSNGSSTNGDVAVSSSSSSSDTGSSSSGSGVLSPCLQELLVDNITFNSTASIRRDPGEGGRGGEHCMGLRGIRMWC